MEKEINFEIKKEKEAIIKEKIETAVTKVKFINEIKTSLGTQIKSNPNSITFIKKTNFQKLVLFFKKFFTKF